MITLTPQMKILIGRDRVDFRKGIDGFAGLCRNEYNEDPLSGKVYVFLNKSGKSIKILMYDGQGFWLCQKRLSQGKFRNWPSQSKNALISVIASEVQVLLWNGDVPKSRVGEVWKKIA